MNNSRIWIPDVQRVHSRKVHSLHFTTFIPHFSLDQKHRGYGVLHRWTYSVVATRFTWLMENCLSKTRQGLQCMMLTCLI